MPNCPPSRSHAGLPCGVTVTHIGAEGGVMQRNGSSTVEVLCGSRMLDMPRSLPPPPLPPCHASQLARSCAPLQPVSPLPPIPLPCACPTPPRPLSSPGLLHPSRGPAHSFALAVVISSVRCGVRGTARAASVSALRAAMPARPPLRWPPALGIRIPAGQQAGRAVLRGRCFVSTRE